MSSLANKCGGEITKSELLSALKDDLSVDVWLTCDPK